MNKINLKLLLFLSFVFNTQNLKANYFLKQLSFGATTGVITALIYNLNNSNADQKLVAGVVGCGVLGTKFFYDLLSSKNGTEIVKAFVSFPFYTGIAVGTGCLIGMAVNN